jgi:hypothetical protein
MSLRQAGAISKLTDYSDCSGPLAAISAGLTSRVTNEQLPVLGRVVREVADEVTVADRSV